MPALIALMMVLTVALLVTRLATEALMLTGVPQELGDRRFDAAGQDAHRRALGDHEALRREQRRRDPAPGPDPPLAPVGP